MTQGTRDIEAMALLEQALEQPVGNRRAWIKAQAGIDPKIEARAIELLDAMPGASKRISTGAAGGHDDDTPIPARIGAYKTIEMLGQGGMGAVFKAERDAGDFDHLVAIKLVRPGILSPQLIERFGRERQILAGLSHPGIARLYDGGTTDDGGPFIVMEFIDGVPIDEWARDNALSLDGRLQLIRDVCAAVGFAHQNLVIHRDLTPTNVLVTREGEAKLIDFGIAKPQDEDAASDAATSAVSSSLSALSLTPGYAAPERYTGAAATTLSDIYSLGKLLDTLTGGHIRDADLRAIVEKATADDPAQRYTTTSDLSRDLDRYSRNFPVSARPVSRTGVISKFYQRNKLPVLASAAGLAVLLGALGTAGIAYFRAEAARSAEATRVAQLRELANYMLFDHNEKLQTVVGNSAARADLVDKAQSYLLTLEALSDEDPSLKLDVALGFIEIARIQGVAGFPNFGDPDSALENLSRAEGLLREIGNPADPKIAAGLGTLKAFTSVTLLHGKGKPDEAKTAFADGFRALNTAKNGSQNEEWLRARAELRRAQLESADLGMDRAAMEEALDEFDAEIKAWPTELRQSRFGDTNSAILGYYSAAQHSMGDEPDLSRAVDEFIKAGAKFDTVLEREPNDPIALYWKAWAAYYGGAIARQSGREPDAIRLLESATGTIAQLRLIEENDESLIYFSNTLTQEQAALDARLGRFDEAIDRQLKVIEKRERVSDQSNRSLSNLRDLVYGRMVLSDIARQAGRRTLACGNYAETLADMNEIADRGEQLGYVEDLRLHLETNVKLCDAGAPTSELKGPDYDPQE